MQPAKKTLAVLVVLVFLPLLSHCSKEPKGPQMRPLTAKEAAILAPNTLADIRPRPDLKLDRELPPDRMEALGDTLLRTKEYEGSLINYVQILEKDPSRADIRYKVAVILLLKGQYQGAREELTKVLALEPDMLEAREALALAYMQERSYAQAIKEFQRVLGKDRSRVQTHHLLGVTYLMADQPREAVRELETANSLNPKNLSTYAALGQAYNKNKEYAKEDEK